MMPIHHTFLFLGQGGHRFCLGSAYSTIQQLLPFHQILSSCLCPFLGSELIYLLMYYKYMFLNNYGDLCFCQYAGCKVTQVWNSWLQPDFFHKLLFLVHEFENKKIFRSIFIMLLQKCLYTAFPLVTMEKLFMLLSKAYSSLCRLFCSYSRTLLQHLSLFPTSSVFHLSWTSLSTLKKNHCLDSTHPTNILPPFSPFLAKLGE